MCSFNKKRLLEEDLFKNPYDIEDWTNLTIHQQNGIVQAIEGINQGNGISHEIVMINIRQRFLSE